VLCYKVIHTLIALTLACAAASLWTRRLTWSCPWEVAPTLGIALYSVGAVLTSPLATTSTGRALHAVTGIWHLDDYLGHFCYIGAGGAIVNAVLSRLVDDDILRARIRRLELLTILVVSAMLAALAMSDTDSGYYPDMYDVPVDIWLALYWLLINGMLMYLFIYAARELLILRQDERSRLTADMYIVGSVYGFLGCVAGLANALMPQLHAMGADAVVWFFSCASGVSFIAGAAYSWHTKMRPFRKLQRGVRTTRRELRRRDGPTPAAH
jgi:hypothetical protein